MNKYCKKKKATEIQNIWHLFWSEITLLGQCRGKGRHLTQLDDVSRLNAYHKITTYGQLKQCKRATHVYLESISSYTMTFEQEDQKSCN